MCKEGLAQTSYRGGYQNHHPGPEFCQLQLADHMAVLLFPYREWVLSYPPPSKGGRIRASPGQSGEQSCQW